MSNYDGWLIKINGHNGHGDFIIDTKRFIRADSYKTALKPIDLDSYTDAYGFLHRNVLEHVPSKTEFETPEMLTNRDMAELMKGISDNYLDELQRKVLVTVYCPELDTVLGAQCYLTQEMYLVDPEFQIYGNYHGVIHYRPVRLCFIAY